MSENALMAVVVVAVLLVAATFVVLFAGTPDLHDAIISHVRGF